MEELTNSKSEERRIHLVLESEHPRPLPDPSHPTLLCDVIVANRLKTRQKAYPGGDQSGRETLVS